MAASSEVLQPIHGAEWDIGRVEVLEFARLSEVQDLFNDLFYGPL